MNMISRYIHSQLTISTALISFVLVGILWLFVSVKALESILNKGMTIQLFATLTLLTKNAFLEEMRKQYVLTARAKGLPEKIILFKPKKKEKIY